MDTVNFKIEPSGEAGLSTLSVVRENGQICFLHSRISPSRESSSFAKLISSITQDTVVVIGCGLGYHLADLADNSHIRKLVIIDRIPGIEKEITGNIILRKLFSSLTIDFLTGNNLSKLEEVLNVLIDLSNIKGIGFIEHPSSIRCFPEYYDGVRRIIDRVIRKKTGNLATAKSFSKLFLRNSIKHLQTLRLFSPFSFLQNKWAGYPCVIISSGPSVDHYIDMIAENRDRFFVMCIDSAYPLCRSKNIKPDICVSVDPQPWILEHLIDFDITIPIITTLSSWPLKSNKSFLSINTHPFAQILDHFFPGIGSCDSHTGTVAGDAIMAARHLGASRIYITGLDFSFPKRLIYSRGTAYNKRFSSFFNNRFMTVENFNEAYIRKSRSRQNINDIPTRQSFLQFRDGISSLVSSGAKNKIFHLTNGGLEIKGTVKVSTQNDALVLLSNEQIIEKRGDILDTIINAPVISGINHDDILKIFTNPKIIDEAIIESTTEEYHRQNHHRIVSLLQRTLERQ